MTDVSDSSVPKISIIVPVYKVEQYLYRCLDSIVAQTFTDWECLLIDDGSPDDSGAICDEYAEKDSRFRVIHQKNSGVSAARNAGLAVARGEWIGFVDSDDWIEPDFCKTLLVAIEQTGKDCATCGYLNEFVGETIYDPVSQKLLALSRNESIEKIYDRRLWIVIDQQLC